MKHVPREPKADVNVTPVHPLVDAATLVTGLAAIFVLIAVLLIFLVDIVLLFVSRETEAEFFADFAPADIVEAEEDHRYAGQAEDLLGRLAARWDDAPYHFRLAVSEADEPNAMAFPGGLIVVTTALLDNADSENELAFVLGHEIGHYRNRDHLRMLGRGIALGLLLGVLTGTGQDFGVGIADLTARGFGRQQEADADRFGLTLVQAEYGHVGGALEFFARVGDDTPEFFAYFGTHPAGDERIEALERLAADEGWSVTGRVTPLAAPD